VFTIDCMFTIGCNSEGLQICGASTSLFERYEMKSLCVLDLESLWVIQIWISLFLLLQSIK
jgi:hypothetical protein